MENFEGAKKEERTLGRETLKILKAGLDAFKAALAPLGMSDEEKLRLQEKYKQEFRRKIENSKKPEQ